MMFSINYNEGYEENPSIYNLFLNKMKKGEITHKYFDEIRYRASRLAQYPDKEYRKIFENYAYGKAKSPEEAEQLLNDIVSRKNNILSKVEEIHHEIFQEWFKNKSKNSTLKQANEVKSLNSKKEASQLKDVQSLGKESLNKQKDVEAKNQMDTLLASREKSINKEQETYQGEKL